MKRLVGVPVLASALLALSGCCWVSRCLTPQQQRGARFSQLEEQVLTFSRKVNAYCAEHDCGGRDLDGGRLLEILTAVYPSGKNHDAIREIERTYVVRAHALDGGHYALMLCDRDRGTKILEDLSCRTVRVEVPAWRNPEPVACEFEPNPERFCAAEVHR